MGKNKGKSARIGKKLYDEIERINIKRVNKFGIKGLISTQIITDLIVVHKESWTPIANDIINVDPEKIKERRETE